MKEQKRILGIIFLVWGMLNLLVLLLLLIFVNKWLPLLAHEEEVQIVSDILTSVLIFVILIKPIPVVITGIGLLNNHKWADVMSLIVGCLALLFFPIGTAIGVFAIYIYLKEREEARKVEAAP